MVFQATIAKAAEPVEGNCPGQPVAGLARDRMTREPDLVGYAGVSKGDYQSNAAQRRALDAAGCKRIFEETASGGR